MQGANIRFWRKAAAASAALGVAWTLAFAGSSGASPRAHVKKHVVMAGYTCTVVATRHHSHVVGHAGSVVCGAQGNDTLVASGPGKIVLIGGPGHDTLVASSSPSSQDVLIGGTGTDTIDAGSAGDDVISAGTGSDSIDCGSGGATVTVAGVGPEDTESSDCQGSNVTDASQEWHGTVVAFDPTNPGTMTVSVSESSDNAQAWLATQSPSCDQTNLSFDLSTGPADIQVEGGATLASGDGVEITSNAGTVNCQPVAIEVQAQPAGS